MEFAAVFGFNSPHLWMVGGAPVTKSCAEAIGADGCSETAAASVELAGCLAGEKQEGS